MRTRRHLAALTILVALVPVAVPRADACHVGGAVPHECCAPTPAVESTPSASCCATDASSPPPSAATQGPAQNRCDCVHAPEDPATVTVGTPTPTVDDIEPSALHSMTAVPRPIWTENGSRSDLAHGLLPPPLFILDCAFLI